MKAALEERVIDWLSQQSGPIYLVGGCVRDQILNRPVYDLDLAVPAGGLKLARHLANAFHGAYYPLDKERDTGRALLQDDAGQELMVDVAGFRGMDLTSDLADRDFTINALAADVQAPAEIIDQHDGLADLEAGLIRPVSPAAILNDPLRALRAVRQAAELGFSLTGETESLIRRDGQAIVDIASERTRDELARLVAQPRCAPYLRALDRLGLLTVVLPELEPLRDLTQAPPHELDVLSHSLQTVYALEDILDGLGLGGGPVELGRTEELGLQELVPFAGHLDTHLSQLMSAARPRLVTLKLAALLHDVGKSTARTVEEGGRVRFIGHETSGVERMGQALQRLRFSRSEVRLAETIAVHHMRPLQLASENKVTSRAVYRFFRDTEKAGVDVLLHALADNLAKSAALGRQDGWPHLVTLTARMLGDYWQRFDQGVAPAVLVTGKDLMAEQGLAPGPLLGETLAAVHEAQAVGEVTSREQALAWANNYWLAAHSTDQV